MDTPLEFTQRLHGYSDDDIWTMVRRCLILRNYVYSGKTDEYDTEYDHRINRNQPYMITIKVGDTNTTMSIDTGANRSTISENIYHDSYLA